MRLMFSKAAVSVASLLVAGVLASPALADDRSDDRASLANCPVGYSKLKEALDYAVAKDGSGFNLQMWATVVDRDGVVCAVASSGANRGDQWPGSRVISAQKANTANAFGLPGFAISTANLYSAVQPGGSLFGLQESNPVNPSHAYAGPFVNYGKANDPLVGRRVGGVNVFGGGLGLYPSKSSTTGAVGVSGDTSCRDHNVAWHIRNYLKLDHVPAGPAASFGGDPSHPDNIIFDIDPKNASNNEGTRNLSKSGWGHPTCFGTIDPTKLPVTSK